MVIPDDSDPTFSREFDSHMISEGYCLEAMNGRSPNYHVLCLGMIHHEELVILVTLVGKSPMEKIRITSPTRIIREPINLDKGVLTGLTTTLLISILP